MSAAARPAALPGFVQRLGSILAGLRDDLAPRAAKDRALAALVLNLCNRLNRLLLRIAAVSGRRRQAPPAPDPRPRAAPKTPPPPDALPRQAGWLVRRVRECGVRGTYLRILLEEPEVREMLAASPRMRRLLRPLWRMLRTDPPPGCLRPPPAAPAAPPRPAASPPRPRLRRRQPAARATAPRHSRQPVRRPRKPA